MDGKELKETGIRRVAENNQQWLEIIRRRAREIVLDYGTVDIDMLRFWWDAAKDRYPGPNHPNAWGAIFIGKEWIHVGEKKSIYKSNHYRRIGIWELRAEDGGRKDENL